MPRTNGKVIKELQRQRGWTNEELAKKAKICPRLVSTARSGKKVSQETIDNLALAFKCEPKEITHPDDIPPKPFEHDRCVTGTWSGSGEDIFVRTHFEYKIEPLTYPLEVNLQQTPSGKVTGTAKSRDRELLSIQGEIKETGNFVFAEYHSLNRAVHDYGYVVLAFDSSGDKMTGFFLGRERGHGTTFMLARIELKRADGSA